MIKLRLTGLIGVLQRLRDFPASREKLPGVRGHLLAVVVAVVILVCSSIGVLVTLWCWQVCSHSVILPLSLPELTGSKPRQGTCTPAYYFSFNIILIFIPSHAIIVHYLHQIRFHYISVPWYAPIDTYLSPRKL